MEGVARGPKKRGALGFVGLLGKQQVMASSASWRVHFLRFMVGLAPGAGWSPGRPEGATIGADLVDRGGV